MPDHAGKTAIVTGASRGIGVAVARRLATSGARVVVNYKQNEAGAEQAVTEIRAAGGQAVAIRADVSRSEDAARLFDQAEEAFGAIDILINNAGSILYSPLADVDDEAFDRLMAVNVKSTFLTCKLAAARMREGGSIVNLSSSTTKLMLPTYAAYVATKGAIEQMSHVFAKEMGSRSIRVNVISPGPTNTDLFNEGKTEAQRQGMAAMAALGRIGEPEEIASVVNWIVSAEAGWVTGQNLLVNGRLI